MNPSPQKKEFIQTTNFGTFWDKYIVVICGLPSCGKSYMAEKLAWYLSFVYGIDTTVFNLDYYINKY